MHSLQYSAPDKSVKHFMNPEKEFTIEKLSKNWSRTSRSPKIFDRLSHDCRPGQGRVLRISSQDIWDRHLSATPG